MSPETPLTPAVRDVLAALDQIAREHPEASAPALVLALARKWIPARLKKRAREERT